MSEAVWTIWAGVTTRNPWFWRVAPFEAHDAAALLQDPAGRRIFILRDLEVDRAQQAGVADEVHPYSDFAPEGGLSADRDVAAAQAAAEALRRAGAGAVVADRSLPLLFASEIEKAGVSLRCDPQLGVLERRRKSEREIDALRRAQRKTEAAIVAACRLIASATARADGTLEVEGEPLTSERVRSFINQRLLESGMAPCQSIVASGPTGADCHDIGHGPLRTGEPIILDVFPMDSQSRYFGDCTRTVVHGGEEAVPPELAAMHEATLLAKQAAERATRAGASAQAVHEAACAVFRDRGYAIGLPGPDEPEEQAWRTARYVHGTGHGVGLEVHEPPLLDEGGPALLAGEALTIEPGLYRKGLGGVRVEDMVVVTDSGCENLNQAPMGLVWED